MKEGKVFCFHHGWHFLLADEFPMQKALEKHKDKNGRCFYELDYIEENLTDDLSYDAIAAMMAISEADLQRSFKTITGMTISEYIRKSSPSFKIS